MTYKSLLTLFTLLSFQIISAQTVSNVEAYQDGNEIVISYELNIRCKTQAYYSIDGGKTFMGPISAISGAIGKDAHIGENRFRWYVLREIDKLASNNVVFKIVPVNINGELVIKTYPKETIVFVDKKMYIVRNPIRVTINEGYYDISFSKAGYNSIKKHVNVVAGESQTISARLSKNNFKNAKHRSYKSSSNGNSLTKFWDKRGFNIGSGIIAGYDVEYGVCGGAGIYWRLFRHNSLFNFNLGCEYAYYSKGGGTFQFPLLINWNMFSMFGDCSDERACGYIGFGITPVGKYGICPYNIQIAVCMRHWDIKLNAIVSDYQVQMALGTAYYF